jgi:hypothetical protein
MLARVIDDHPENDSDDRALRVANSVAAGCDPISTNGVHYCCRPFDTFTVELAPKSAAQEGKERARASWKID